MAVKKILRLGNPVLYQISEPVTPDEMEKMKPVVEDLHDTMMDFRKKYGTGRAIAAPQIGVMKRLVYMHTGESTVFINPEITYRSEEMIELWDDCMSFPEILVRVKRHKSIRISYSDLEGQEITADYEGDLSELLQHECDHLDGILAVSRAIDDRSFMLRSEKELFGLN